MEKIVECDGKTYVVDTTPILRGGYKRIFAEIYGFAPRRASGVIANFLAEYKGKDVYTFDRLCLSDDELVEIVLKLGHKFSTSRAWKNLFDWAYFRQRNDNQEEAVL